MAVRIYVSRDAAAQALGADETAAALLAAAGADIELVRVGSRGMVWLEPLVEVTDAAGQRIAYGPVMAEQVTELLGAGLLQAAPHALRLGRVEDMPYFAKQERLTFARVGIIDPVSVDEYVAHGGYEGLKRALTLDGATIVQEVTDSGLRGRGGAAFPTGIKWKTVLQQQTAQKYVVCNADEGDSGTFSDRMLMEGDPLCLVEGMTIAGVAVGATQGFIYLRSEYPHAQVALEQAIAAARSRGYLGRDVCGSGKAFDLEVRMGAGATLGFTCRSTSALRRCDNSNHCETNGSSSIII